jgi:hypothetical protein
LQDSFRRSAPPVNGSAGKRRVRRAKGVRQRRRPELRYFFAGALDAQIQVSWSFLTVQHRRHERRPLDENRAVQADPFSPTPFRLGLRQAVFVIPALADVLAVTLWAGARAMRVKENPSAREEAEA